MILIRFVVTSICHLKLTNKY